MSSFATALKDLCRVPGLVDGRPNASEAVAAVLLARAGATPADVESSRLLVIAGDRDVHGCIHRLLSRLYGKGPQGRLSDADGFDGAAPPQAGRRIVLADSTDLSQPRPWLAAAGETGAGVAMVAKALDDVHHVYRVWAAKTVTLEGVDVDEILCDVVEYLTGQRPRLASGGAAGTTVGDVRAALGPRTSCAEAIRLMSAMRDGRSEHTEQARREAECRSHEARLRQGAAASPSRIERELPLSRMSGFGEAREWGLQAAADIRAYAAGDLPWADVDRGLLLSGAPGTGKTRFAHAFASEANVPILESSFSALVGASATGHNVEKPLLALMKKARETAPCLLFLDEIDSIPSRISAHDHNSTFFNSVANAFLQALDGAEPREGVIVIAATNHPERLDPALLRPGRLDRHIRLTMPSLEDLEGIIRHHLGTDIAVLGDQMRPVARACRGMSPAAVEQACRDARRRARTMFGRKATPGDIGALLAERRATRTAREERIVTVHEAGHAVTGLALGIGLDHVDVDHPHAMLARLGATTAVSMQDEMTMILSGRAAEQVLLGEVTGGAQADLRAATEDAIRYHARFGFGSLGLVSVDIVDLERSIVLPAVRDLVDRMYDRALELVRNLRGEVELVAEALVRNRYLTGEEVEVLLAAARDVKSSSAGRR